MKELERKSPGAADLRRKVVGALRVRTVGCEIETSEDNVKFD